MNVLNINKKGENVPVMVFKKEDKEKRVHYTCGISKKNQDNSWTNAYIPCVFNKGIVVDNKELIVITNAVLDFYNKLDENGKILDTKFYLRIFEFDRKSELDQAEDNNLPF